ncbi:MAG: hypothetical protein IT539_16325 [Bradyrhizobiaceae bacterium]|nr:hypothetical protein [Bradyrhizobiaceae bacterium]
MKAAIAESEASEDGEKQEAQSAGTGSPGSFLTGIAMLLRESVQQFESISGGISDAVMSRPGMVDRNLVVTLQAFDRLQQEFVAVADILTRYSGTMADVPASGAALPNEEEAIAAIAMSDLKERLLRHLQASRSEPVGSPPDGEEEF